MKSLQQYIKPIMIGNITLENNIFLAPMAGVTDDVFRQICKQQGAGMVCTEMVSAKGIHYNSKNTFELLKISKNTRPVAIQIFGSDPEIISEICEKFHNPETKIDVDIIDINMGCPAPKIVKNGEGSALMKNIKLAGEIINAAVQASDKPVTVKFRRGYKLQEESAVEMALIAEEKGASAVCVHGRFREQFYSGKADWEIIRKVKEAVKIPVIGNGDIKDRQSALKIFDQTGCDAIAIGRGALGNPWIFSELLNETNIKPSIEEIIKTIISHMDMLIELKGERIAVNEMRKHIAWYIKGISGAAAMRNHIFQMNERNKIVEYLKCI